jgi:protein gp37
LGSSTGIEWTDATWNPFIGCHKVSQGCKNCYAEKLVNGRMGGDFGVVRRSAPATFYAPLRWARTAAKRGTALRVFTCSISDFFIEEADPWRAEAWRMIRDCRSLTFQILTKRPERILGCLPDDWTDHGPGYPNVWLGVSGETLELVERRAEILVSIPAARRFLSAEPWLDTRTDIAPLPANRDSVLGVFDWVILGGESGPGARPLDLDSARAVRDACVRLEVPFFLKQLGGHPDKRADGGAVLDGRTWKELPA